MDNNTVFNAAVCLIGMLIFSVHAASLLMKKKRRKDENALLNFILFTIIHFAAYFAFTAIKANYQSDALIMGFYTTFYIANNIEIFLLFLYLKHYVGLPKKSGKWIEVSNVVLCSVFIVLDFVNLFTPLFFYAEGGVYYRTPTMFFGQGYQFVTLVAVFLIAATNKKLHVREKVAFGIYCVLPAIAIVLQNFFKGYAIAYLSIIVATEVLFFFLNVEKNIVIAEEESKAKAAQVKMMLSQIQPHFIYNVLSSLSTLITIDPKKAQAGLDDFTEYLRANLSSVTENGLIDFKEELKHIETFVSLEKIRFGSRVNVVYEIGVSDFRLPPLTVQPLVENAIRHGILPKAEGGMVTLRTYEEGERIVVEVIDDGVGFDMDAVDFASNEHIGLNNISYRLKKMGDDALHLESVPGKGTKATVRVRK